MNLSYIRFKNLYISHCRNRHQLNFYISHKVTQVVRVKEWTEHTCSTPSHNHNQSFIPSQLSVCTYVLYLSTFYHVKCLPPTYYIPTFITANTLSLRSNHTSSTLPASTTLHRFTRRESEWESYLLSSWSTSWVESSQKSFFPAYLPTYLP